MSEITSKRAETGGGGGFPRRRALLGFLACLIALLAVGCSGSGAKPVVAQQEGTQDLAEQPNILFVLADDLDLDSVEGMPNIRSLVAEGGATFENAFISYPACCPSRATMLTGEYAHNHNVRGNKNPAGGSRSSAMRGTRRTRSPWACKRPGTEPPSSASTSTITLTRATRPMSHPAGTSGTPR